MMNLLASWLKKPWFGPLLALLCVYGLFAALTPDTFLRTLNLVTMLRQTVVVVDRRHRHGADHHSRRHRSLGRLHGGAHDRRGRQVACRAAPAPRRPCSGARRRRAARVR